MQLAKEKQREQKREENPEIDSQVSDQEDPPKDYEQMIQKLEAEVRNHIRVGLVKTVGRTTVKTAHREHSV